MNANPTPTSAREHFTADTSTATAAQEQAERASRSTKATIARHLTHPLAHVLGLLAAHTAALIVLEKTPLLALLSLH
jgi:hypothetical protein